MEGESLEALMEEARDALLHADFDRLASLTTRTEAALAAVPPGDPALLLRLRARAEENAGLAEAAARGLASLCRKPPAGDGFSTYDARGRRARIDPMAAMDQRRL